MKLDRNVTEEEAEAEEDEVPVEAVVEEDVIDKRSVSYKILLVQLLLKNDFIKMIRFRLRWHTDAGSIIS